MKSRDVYHISVAYLLTLTEDTRKHIGECFDFADDSIKLDALNEPWQTSTSRKATRLAFNLWNDYSYSSESYTDKDGYEMPLPSVDYSVSSIFCCSYAPYFWQAVKLRFPEYTEE